MIHDNWAYEVVTNTNTGRLKPTPLLRSFGAQLLPLNKVFLLLFDNVLMAFISTYQSKCNNYERWSCEAPRSRSDNIDIYASIQQFLQFDLLV